uniref:glucuronosyltransferase n=1 Tax=Parastrongyloides trichosuri TaxID=131310 RepID=A0A0N5A0N3_PARTI
MLLKFLIFLLLFLTPSNGYKILIFNPKVGHSHVNFFSQLTRILTENGHDVTVITSNIDSRLKDPYYTPGKIFFSKPSDMLVDMIKGETFVKDIWKSSKNFIGQMALFNTFKKATRSQGETFFEDKDLEKFVTSQHFDVGIAEGMYPYMFGLFKYWNIKTTIVASSSVMFDLFYPMFGIPFPTSYLPSMIMGAQDKMTYMERGQNILTHIAFSYLSGVNSEYATLKDLFDKKFGPEYYEGIKIMTNCSFVLINSNPFFDFPSPKSPKMIEISGIGIPKPKSVDKYFDEILNKRNRTVLISFGSVARSTYMEQDQKDEILKVIKSLPDITFIWKYETPEDGIGRDVDNLVLSKWVPQNDLLNDKRLSLFITHGGMGSTTEIAFSNVPSLAVPILGDQMRNVKLLERLEIGLVVNKEMIRDSGELRKKILEVLDNDKYRINSVRTAEMLKNRPISSEQLLVKHVEFACRFGQLPMLDLGSKDMGFIEYYNLDIIIPIIAFILLMIYISFKMICKIVSKLFSQKIKED